MPAYFSPATFGFLGDLAANNSREWFERNRARYEEHVKQPALRFIADFAPRLRRISPHFRADPRPVGGSLFRIHRDVRFSMDKSPYKTHAGIHFRHFASKTAHAPGFYLHLEPGEVFVGVGIWRPDASTLDLIRGALHEDPDAWRKVVKRRAFASRFRLSGESLSRPPRGYPPDHPFIDDLKRKDFVAVAELSEKDVASDRFMEEFAAICRAGAPLNRFVCDALALEY